jgi:hypothetical protein
MSKGYFDKEDKDLLTTETRVRKLFEVQFLDTVKDYVFLSEDSPEDKRLRHKLAADWLLGKRKLRLAGKLFTINEALEFFLDASPSDFDYCDRIRDAKHMIMQQASQMEVV